MEPKMKRKALELDSVTLIYFNCGRDSDVLKPTREEFTSLERAIRYACNSMGSPCFHDPIIVESADNRKLLWEPRFGTR
jgi:hypothetical protein